MENQELDINQIVNHWVSRADSDFTTMNNLFVLRDYPWALFLGHLVIERLLKAAVVKTTLAHAPLTHDLRRLYKLSGLSIDDEQVKWLDTITTFNLNARYDDYKQDFYHKCTPDFSSDWVSNIKLLREWILMRL